MNYEEVSRKIRKMLHTFGIRIILTIRVVMGNVCLENSALTMKATMTEFYTYKEGNDDRIPHLQ